MATQTIDIRVVDKTQRSLGNIEKRLGNVEGKLIGINKIAGLAVTALGAIGGASLIRNTVNTIRRFEDLQAQLKTITGSARLAGVAMGEIEKFASQTTFGVDEVTAAFIILKRSGLDATTQSLTEFGNVAAANGKTFTQFAEAVADAAVGEFERLKEFGIKVSKEQEGYIVRLGNQQIATAQSYNEVIEAVQKLGKEGERFGSGLQDRADTLSGALSNLNDKANAVQKAFGDGGFRQAFTDLVKTFTELLARATPLAQTIGEKLGFAVFKFNNFIKETNFNMEQFLQGAQIAISVLGGAGLLKVIQGVTTGIKALTVAMMKNPLGLLAVAAASAATYLSMENGLGRTISQVVAVMRKLGDMAGSLAGYLRNKVARIIDFLTGVFDDFVDSIVSGYNAIAEFVPFLNKVDTTGKKVRESIKSLVVDGFEVAQSAVEETADIVVRYTKENETMSSAISDAKRIIGELTKEFKAAGLSYDAATEKALAQYEATYKLNEEGSNTVGTQQEIQQAMGKTGDATDDTTEKLKKFRKTLGLENISDIEKNIADTRKKYKELVDERIGFAQDLSKIKDRYDNDDYVNTLTLLDNERQAYENFYDKVNEMEEKAARSRLQTQLAIQEAAKKTTVIQLNELEKLTLQEIGAQERRRQIAQDRVEFEKKSEMEKTQFGIQQAGEFFSALGQSNKKAFEAAKAFNIANAIMNTYAGATKALATYPPPFNFIAAAAVVASGLAQVSAIRSQQYQARQRGGALNIGTPTVVGEDGPELIVPKQPSTVIPREVAQAMEGMGGGSEPVVVNFNISTVDAQDFDELLVKRRGTIVNIINQALQKRGKQGVY